MRSALCLLALLCTAAAAADQGAGPNLGQAMTPEETAAVSLTVMPDGEGLPPGSGDVTRGAEVYANHCRACHGEAGRGGPNDALVGGQGTLAGERPLRTIGSYWPYATTVFDYVRRAMPYQAPGTLENDEVYAVTAYLLYLNGIIRADGVMNSETLPGVVMPNREGFRWARWR